MNLPPPSANPVGMADVQGDRDTRDVPIQWVGIKDLLYPIRVQDLPLSVPTRLSGPAPQRTVGTFDMQVALPGSQRGTHMSRFVAILEQMRAQSTVLDVAAFQTMAENMRHTLHSSASKLGLGFVWFQEKQAPISGVTSLMDYSVYWEHIACDPDALASEGIAPVVPGTTLRIVVPVTSLCPCSKQVSDYGAHNQRSHVCLEVQTTIPLSMSFLIGIVERHASCALYGLLKRPDEKFVTEWAYDHPQFVEDMVRDIAVSLRQIPAVRSFSVSSENFESIHNHSAYALIKE